MQVLRRCAQPSALFLTLPVTSYLAASHWLSVSVYVRSFHHHPSHSPSTLLHVQVLRRCVQRSALTPLIHCPHTARTYTLPHSLVFVLCLTHLHAYLCIQLPLLSLLSQAQSTVICGATFWIEHLLFSLTHILTRSLSLVLVVMMKAKELKISRSILMLIL